MRFIYLLFLLFCMSATCKKRSSNPEPLIDPPVRPVPTTPPKATLPPATLPLPTRPTLEEMPDIGSTYKNKVIVGAEQMPEYMSYLKNKRVALVVNHSSRVGKTHLCDTLLSQKINIVRIFAPEHGFRGTADAGEDVKSGKDARTGIPILSLYGNKKKKPLPEDLADVDVIVFDIQDVGARFYTYISTLFYVLEACAENNKPIIVLDRPNPNGHYVDGPVLEPSMTSFVGIVPIPIVHGCTIGELAQMFVGEKWLSMNKFFDLKVIKCLRYDHNTPYQLPLKPSPNLPDMRSIYLYPSICLFEGTVASVGRGTDHPFQVIGHPDYPDDRFYFVPKPNDGAKLPIFEGKECWGVDLRSIPIAELYAQKRLNLGYLLDFYRIFEKKETFFLSTNFFDKLAGTTRLRLQISAGMSETDIRATWAVGLQKYNNIRLKYLLYPDFK